MRPAGQQKTEKVNTLISTGITAIVCRPLNNPFGQERKCLQLLLCFSKNYSIWIHCILKAIDPPYKAQKKHSMAEQEIFLKRVSSG